MLLVSNVERVHVCVCACVYVRAFVCVRVCVRTKTKLHQFVTKLDQFVGHVVSQLLSHQRKRKRLRQPFDLSECSASPVGVLQVWPGSSGGPRL